MNATIELILEIVLGIVMLLCFFGGSNLLKKGVKGFLDENSDPPQRLDNIFRFLSGIYFGLGFLMCWIIVHLPELRDIIYFIGIVVICSAAGRLYSTMKVGSAGRNSDITMMLEFIGGIAIIILQWFRAH